MFIEKAAALLIYVIPFLLAAAGYFWLFMKIRKMTHRVWQIVAIILFAGGCLYTVWELKDTLHEALSPMNFNIILIGVNCLIMVVTSIVIALGKEEEKIDD